MPPLPHDDSVSLTDRKLHHCYFCYIVFHVFLFVSLLLYIILTLNIQESVQYSLAVYINWQILWTYVYNSSDVQDNV